MRNRVENRDADNEDQGENEFGGLDEFFHWSHR